MTSSETRPPLQLSPSEMRVLGYRVIDIIVEHAAGIRSQAVVRPTSRHDLEQRVREPIPDGGVAPDIVLDRLVRDVFPAVAATDHPRFFAFIPSPGNFISIMADTLAAGHNVFAGHWLLGSMAAEIELVTLDWLRTLLGLPPSASGLFVSGGSMANLIALATARHVKLGTAQSRGVVYGSDQTHASLEKGLRLLGFEPRQYRMLPTDARCRLAVADLRCAIAADRAAGQVPFCVIATAGTTNTGAVDPLREVGALCAEEHLWMHVDGAYGAAAILTDTGREALAGLELADSVTLDPHKWWFQPYEIGCVLVRDARHLHAAFGSRARHAPYLDAAARDEADVNFYERGVQLTRGFRALKLWMSLQVFGVSAFRDAVARGIRLAEYAERALRRDPCWDVITPAQLGIVTFRYRRNGLDAATIDRTMKHMVSAMMADGFAAVTSTALRDRMVLRLCPIHPAATEADVSETLERLKAFGAAASGDGL